MPTPEEINANDASGATEANESETFAPFASLALNLSNADLRTRVLFASRETLPAQDGLSPRHLRLGTLDRLDAIELVKHVLAAQQLSLQPEDAGDEENALDELVDSLNRHARALVLLTPEVARRGVRGATREAAEIFAEMVCAQSSRSYFKKRHWNVSDSNNAVTCAVGCC